VIEVSLSVDKDGQLSFTRHPRTEESLRAWCTTAQSCLPENIH